MQVAGGLPHRPLAAPVVAGRGGGVAVTSELLHRGEVAYSIQQVAHEGLPEIVGGDLLYLRLPVAPLDHLVDGLVRERCLLLAVGVRVLHQAVLPYGQEERLFGIALAPYLQPSGEQEVRSALGVDSPLLVALAPDAHRSLIGVVVR